MAAAPAPSQFSRLLRQSRVASFDPTIPQVYSTPSAYAARGDWGLKRPLPSNSNSPIPGSSSSGASDHPGALRFLEIQHIDTPEGQTIWKEREKETLFLKRWQEADARLAVDKAHSHIDSPAGSHGPRPHTRYLQSTERYLPAEIPGPIVPTQQQLANETEAEREARLYNNRWRAMQKHYAARGAADPAYKGLDFMGERSHSPAFGHDADKFTTRPRMAVNYNALTDKQFEKFLAQVRGSRHEWKAFFAAKERSRLLDVIRSRQERAYAAALEVQRDAERRGATKKPLPPKPDAEAALAKMMPAEIDMLEQSRDLDATRDAFRLLRERSIAASTAASNERLPGASQPTTLHPHAGLQYSQPDLFYTNLLGEPLPGRVIHEVLAKSGSRSSNAYQQKSSDGRSVLVGGHVSYLHAPRRADAPPTIDWSRQEPKQGTALFRIVNAYRTSQAALRSGVHRDMLTPRVDVGYVHSDVAVVSRDIDAPRTMSDVRIGSPEYVGKVEEDATKPALRGPGEAPGGTKGGRGGFDATRRAPKALGGMRFSPNEKRRQQELRRASSGGRRGGAAGGVASDKGTSDKMFETLDGLVAPQADAGAAKKPSSS